MEVLGYIVEVLYLLLCLALTVIVLFQNSKQQGLSGSIGGTAETFFGKNKGRTIDAKLRKITAWLAGIFILYSLVLATLIARGVF